MFWAFSLWWILTSTREEERRICIWSHITSLFKKSSLHKCAIYFSLWNIFRGFQMNALIHDSSNTKQQQWMLRETYLLMNVEDKTRFVFNDVFSRVLFKQLFLPIHDKIIWINMQSLTRKFLSLGFGFSFFRGSSKSRFFCWLKHNAPKQSN